MIVFSFTEGILDVMIDPRQRIQVNAIRAGLARHFGRHERARSRPLIPTQQITNLFPIYINTL